MGDPPAIASDEVANVLGDCCSALCQLTDEDPGGAPFDMACSATARVWNCTCTSSGPDTWRDSIGPKLYEVEGLSGAARLEGTREGHTL